MGGGVGGFAGIVTSIRFPLLFVYSQLMSRSPSGKFQAVVKKIPATKKEEEKQFLEVQN